MATSTKPLKMPTSYKQNDLKLVKVAIQRHNIKHTNASTVQPLERDVDNPLTITGFVHSSVVHSSGCKEGKKLLFRRITPNTIQLPQDAYRKLAPGEKRAAPPPPVQVPGPSRQRSASCSSEEDGKHERRSRSRCSEKRLKSNESAPTGKHKRRSSERERSRSRGPSNGRSTDESPVHNEKRSSARSGSRSPSSKHACSKRRSPSHSPPHSRYRSRSPIRPKTPVKEQIRNLSTRRGIFVPDKSARPRDSDSISPTPTSHRTESSSRSRHRSRDTSRERYKHSSRSPTRDSRRNNSGDRYKRGSRSPSRDKHRNSSRDDRDRRHTASRSPSSDRRPEDRRPPVDFADAPEYYPREAAFYNPLITAPFHFIPTMPMMHPVRPFFNDPAAAAYFPPQDRVPFAADRPRKIYNNPKKKYTVVRTQKLETTVISSGANASTTTVTSNGNASQFQGMNPAANGKAMTTER